MLSAISGGCNGFNYNLKLINKKKFDKFFNSKLNPMIIENDEIKLLVDPIAEMYVLGCTIDYVKELGGSFLKVINPNATAQCGCGESFGV